MSDRFFELATPRDMLHKAMREHERLKSDLSIDNVFNFFVTAFHIKDYVDAAGGVPKDKRTDFLKQNGIEMCEFVCVKGKHLSLRDKRFRSKTTGARRNPGAVIGKAAFNVTGINAGPVVLFYVDGEAYDLRGLADRVIDKWHEFFAENNIP
jgi:hypothetical protein